MIGQTYRPLLTTRSGDSLPARRFTQESTDWSSLLSAIFGLRLPVAPLRGLSGARNSRRSSTVLLGVLVAQTTLSGAIWAGAQPAPGLLVPGTRSAVARVVGLDENLERPRFMMELTRRLYDRPASAQGDDLVGRALGEYLDVIEEMELTVEALPGVQHKLSLAFADNRTLRGNMAKAVEALGLKLEKRDKTYRIEVDNGGKASRKRELLAIAGIVPRDVLNKLNAGEEVSLLIPYESVPLFLSVTLWSETIFDRAVPARALFGAIVRDRKASLLYHGLSSLDQSTLEYFSSDPELLRRLYRSHAEVFSVFGRSIRIRDGVVQLEAEPAMAANWTELIDAEPHDPERFVRRLLSRSDGRLALFFDSVTHLDGPRAAFAHGLFLPKTKERQKRFKKLFDMFSSANPEMNLKDTPFRRYPYDPSLLLREIAVGADGRASGPHWHRLWREAFGGEGLPGKPAKDLRKLDPSEPVDAAWLAEKVCLEPRTVRKLRFEMFLFAQRAFSKASIDDAADILTALRGYVRHRTLLVTLERMGLADPSVYAAASRRAAELADIGDRRGLIALAQFQGALALVDRARTVGAFDVRTSEELVASLVSIDLSDRRYEGRIASWIGEKLIPAFRASAPGEPGEPLEVDEERAARLALAGPQNDADDVGRTLVWEGMTYDLDWPRSELVRLEAVRDKQGGNTLAQVLGFARGVEALAKAGTAAEAGERSTAIKQSASALSFPESSGMGQIPEPPRLEREIDRSLERALKIRKDKDVTKVEAPVRSLRRVTDELVADVLASLVYAIHLGQLDGPILVSGMIHRRHDFGLDIVDGDERKQAAWQVAEEIVNGTDPWHLRGSLLSLDVGLARLKLRRLAGAALPQSPKLLAPDRTTFLQSLALMNPLSLRDAERDQIASAIKRGRQRVAALATEPASIPEVAAESGISEWRERALAWTIAEEPASLERAFSLTELYWLGKNDSEPVGEGIDAWGASALPSSGCLCLRFPSSAAWEEYGGRASNGQLAGRIVDLNLLTAETLSDWQLPAELAPGILAFLVNDFVDEVQPMHADDWWGLSRHVLGISTERIKDYVYALTAAGPLFLNTRAQQRTPSQ